MHHPASPWLIRLSLLLVSLAFAACGSGSTQPAGAALQPAAHNTTVTVTAKDFSYTFDPPAVSAGTITFVVQNAGAMAHDFAIQGNGLEQQTPMLDPGQNATLEVMLMPGTYTYKCTVPGHDLLGMKGALTIHSTSD